MLSRRGVVLLALLLLVAGCGSSGRARPPVGHVSGLVFTRGDRIFLADLDGRRARLLARGSMPTLSPDGRSVSFGRDCGSKAGCLFVIAAAGGSARPLGASDEVASWSPDSRRLVTTVSSAAGTGERLVTIDSSTGARHTVAVADRFLGAAFSPDGRRLVFAVGRGADERSDLYVSAWDGGAVRRVTWDDRSSSPIWAPDGWIDFAHREGPLGPFPVRNRSGAYIGVLEAWGKHRIWGIRPDGRGRHVLTRRLARRSGTSASASRPSRGAAGRCS